LAAPLLRSKPRRRCWLAKRRAAAARRSRARRRSSEEGWNYDQMRLDFERWGRFQVAQSGKGVIIPDAGVG